MKLGILADIHENVPNLQAAIAHLQREGVDRFVLLGDVFQDGKRLEETLAMLTELNPVGVFGNHELALSHEPESEIVDMFAPSTLDFFGRLEPRLEINDVSFSHSIPSADPTDPAEYYLGDRPWDPDALVGSFAQFPHRVFLCGHFHCWWATTEACVIDWNGERPIDFETTERYFVVVHAVDDGWCATLDTEKMQLKPIWL